MNNNTIRRNRIDRMVPLLMGIGVAIALAIMVGMQIQDLIASVQFPTAP